MEPTAQCLMPHLSWLPGILKTKGISWLHCQCLCTANWPIKCISFAESLNFWLGLSHLRAAFVNPLKAEGPKEEEDFNNGECEHVSTLISFHFLCPLEWWLITHPLCTSANLTLVNKKRRMDLSKASLLKVAPTAEERTLIHSLFLNTLDTKYDSQTHKHIQRGRELVIQHAGYKVCLRSHTHTHKHDNQEIVYIQNGN